MTWRQTLLLWRGPRNTLKHQLRLFQSFIVVVVVVVVINILSSPHPLLSPLLPSPSSPSSPPFPSIPISYHPPPPLLLRFRHLMSLSPTGQTQTGPLMATSSSMATPLAIEKDWTWYSRTSMLKSQEVLRY